MVEGWEHSEGSQHVFALVAASFAGYCGCAFALSLVLGPSLRCGLNDGVPLMSWECPMILHLDALVEH